MVLIGKAARQRYFCERESSVTHQVTSVLDASVKQKLMRSLPCTRTKTAHEVRCAESGLVRQVAQAQVSLEVRVDELDASAKSVGRQPSAQVRLCGKR